MMYGILLRRGRKFEGDLFVDVVLNGERIPHPRLEALEEALVRSGGCAEIETWITWARNEITVGAQPIYSCISDAHACGIALAFCAALEYFDPSLQGLHGFTRARIERVMYEAQT